MNSLEELALWKRLLITFLPCFVIAIFDPLLGFCLFLLFFERCILSVFPVPGIEFTTISVFLFTLKYGLTYALILALASPLIANILRFIFWKETFHPEERRLILDGDSLINLITALSCWYFKGFGLKLVELMLLILVVKHSLSYVKSIWIGKPDILGPVISSLLNIFLILTFGKFFIWLISL